MDVDYNRTTDNYNQRDYEYGRSARAENYNRSFDSAGSYGKGYTTNDYKSHNTGYGSGTNSERFDSAGSYGGNRDFHDSHPKRLKTYNSFQTDKTTYADQYVQENEQNRQYYNNANRSGGRPNYNRGSFY